MVPKSLARIVIESYHDARGHFGFAKTLSLILEHFFWETLRDDVRDYVRDCLVCARSKADAHPITNPLIMIETKSVRDLLSIDLVGKLPRSGNGFHYVLTCLDVHSRYLVTKYLA
jgi:hypothetical protein